MKKMIFLGCLVLFFSTIVSAQEKIGAPIWNVRDKWVFTRGNTMEIIDADQNSYVAKISGGMFEKSNSTVIFEKSTLNRIYTLEGGKRKKYDWGRRRVLHFPLSKGKRWEDTFWGLPIYNPDAPQIEMRCNEIFIVLGWEDVAVQAGKFKAIEVEYVQHTGARAGNAMFWYVPEAKYFVKCQIDKDYWKTGWDYESVSFKF